MRKMKDMKKYYRFPVVKGIQAGKEYYIGMVPLKMLIKLFPNDDAYVRPEYRAQRKLNEARVPVIKNYIINNRDNYVFSALAASIDGRFSFVSSQVDEVGILEVSFDARFLIIDGQHRKAAIISALEENQEIGEETIPVVFFGDRGLARSQQMFTDLNKHAVKTSNSIAELYDSRDELAVMTRSMISRIPFLDEYVDKERDILGKYSSALFTLNTFYTANRRILSRKTLDSSFLDFIIDYWTLVSKHMIPWRELCNKELSKKELREKYIASQSVVIQAFGKVGSCFFSNKNKDGMEEAISRIELMNWRRNWDGWRLRTIRSNGRMINNESSISLTAIEIKRSMGLSLNDDEKQQEENFQNSIK